MSGRGNVKRLRILHRLRFPEPLGLPIYDRSGRVAMVLQCPGLLEQVRTREAEIAHALQAAAATPDPALAASVREESAAKTAGSQYR